MEERTFGFYVPNSLWLKCPSLSWLELIKDKSDGITQTMRRNLRTENRNSLRWRSTAEIAFYIQIPAVVVDGLLRILGLYFPRRHKSWSRLHSRTNHRISVLQMSRGGPIYQERGRVTMNYSDTIHTSSAFLTYGEYEGESDLCEVHTIS